ncbi:hypothetical protein D0817_25940, partial [Flavobacterium cupreum]
VEDVPQGVVHHEQQAAALQKALEPFGRGERVDRVAAGQRQRLRGLHDAPVFLIEQNAHGAPGDQGVHLHPHALRQRGEPVGLVPLPLQQGDGAVGLDP